ncbi:DciA family protein [Actinomycetaceae bacterium L2_0104]
MADLRSGSRIAAAKQAAASRNGDILALTALDRVRDAAFSRGETRTRRPSAAQAARALEDDSEEKPLGDEVWTPGPGWGDVGSGPRPSKRDPKPIGMLLSRAIRDKGWKAQLEIASVASRWEKIVGPNVARHCTVEEFTADGILTLRASSSSWETQIRALLAALDARIAEEIGEGVVKQIIVKGPDKPSWKHGRFSVPGRGPRDTYG